MKMSKRIFVCLIVLALSVSVLAVSAFADGSDLKYTIENHKNILEYYEEPAIFGLNFDDEDAVASGYVNAQLVNENASGATKNTAAIVADDSGNKYLSLVGGKMPNATNPVYLVWDAESAIDDFRLELDIAAVSGKTVELFVSDTPADKASVLDGSSGTAILKIDFSAGEVLYHSPEADGGYASVPAELAADTFYHLSVVYSVVDNVFTASLSLGENVVAAVENGVLPYTTVSHVRFGCGTSNIMRATLKLDNVIASGGSFARLESDKIPETERAIADFLTICADESVSLEDKVAILKTGLTLINTHGVTGETEEGKANVLSLQKVGVKIFAGQISGCLDAIVPDGDYNERLERATAAKVYYDLIPEDVSFMGDELAEITAVIDAFEKELSDLEAFKADSEAVIAALADAQLTNTNLKNYSYLKGYYEKIVDLKPYPGYPGIAEIIDSYNAVIERYLELELAGKTFVEGVAAAADTTKSFGARFTAFLAARDNYFDDPAYPEIATALASYDAVAAEMQIAIDVCDGFILNVSRADYSQYLSAKKSALASALESLDEIKEKYLEYPGITDGIAQYEALVADVTASEAAATAYVAAVTELQAKLGTLSNAELAVEVAKLEELKKTGNVIGVDGVTEANIILNNIKSDLELTEGYRDQFTTIVGKLESAAASNVFTLALEAYQAKVDAEKYAGVDSADEAKFNAKVAEYNAKIQALNAGFAAANDVACNTVSASSGSPSDDGAVGRVIALIKKIYE